MSDRSAANASVIESQSSVDVGTATSPAGTPRPVPELTVPSDRTPLPVPELPMVVAGTPLPVPALPVGWLRQSTAGLQANHMLRNSLYLLVSTGLQAGLGFLFWILAAHLFASAQVGRATSLISATTLVGFLALLGLNSTLVRYLPTSKHRDTLVTAGVLLVSAVGAVLALGYALAVPALAPGLAFLQHRALYVVAFVFMGAAAAVNLVTDSIFIAFRRSGVNALVDGGIGGVVRLVLLAVVAGSGAFGLYVASVGGFAVAALVSLVLIVVLLRLKPRLAGSLGAMRPLLRFSGANYVGNVCNLLPALLVPLIVLDRLGASDAAYYYVAFQVANLVYAGGYAVTQNFLAEGGHEEEHLRSLMRRSARVMAALTVPACLVVALGAPLLLDLFGGSYSAHGAAALSLMALAALPVALQNWLVTVLRLVGQLTAIAVSNAVYAVAICGLIWVLAPHGLTMVGAGWLGGALVGVVAAAVAVGRGARRGALAE